MSHKTGFAQKHSYDRPTNYKTNMTEDQWRAVQAVLPQAKPGGRPRRTDMRQIINGLIYWIKTDTVLRKLPKDFPPAFTIHYYGWKWSKEGAWDKIVDALGDDTLKQGFRDKVRSIGQNAHTKGILARKDEARGPEFGRA